MFTLLCLIIPCGRSDRVTIQEREKMELDEEQQEETKKKKVEERKKVSRKVSAVAEVNSDKIHLQNY